jgi:predicted type IV restriction endonuclease
MTADRYAFLESALNFPNMDFQIRNDDGKLSLFDPLRKKFLILTPEEWVRQHMILFLIQHRAYPRSLFTMEKGIQYNTLQKRFDILVLNRDGAPFLLIECKAPNVPLSQKTLEQVCVYNKTVGAEYIGITNGLNHLFFKFDPESTLYGQVVGLPKFT